ncbi:MAG: hypothetical protein ACSLFD_05995 [Solirubrobacterales bacterium]
MPEDRDGCILSLERLVADMRRETHTPLSDLVPEVILVRIDQTKRAPPITGT